MLKMEEREYYKHMNTEFSSKISKIFELSCISDPEEFKKEFSDFIKPYYQKNLISLYAEIQIIYKKPEKVKLVEEVFLSFE